MKKTQVSKLIIFLFLFSAVYIRGTGLPSQGYVGTGFYGPKPSYKELPPPSFYAPKPSYRYFPVKPNCDPKCEIHIPGKPKTEKPKLKTVSPQPEYAIWKDTPENRAKFKPTLCKTSK